jgi:hypothetical protein
MLKADHSEVSIMRRIVFLLSFIPMVNSLAIAQQTMPTTQPRPKPAIAGQPAKYDPELRQNVIKLVDLTGARQRMAASLDQMTERGKEELRRSFPNDTPAFVDEWGKRMRARTSIDDYVAVFILVYEKHFTNAEILEFIQAQQDMKDKKPATISDQLRDKADSIASTVQSEILAGCSQVSAKLGGQISLELAKEHPDWIKSPNAQEKAVPSDNTGPAKTVSGKPAQDKPLPGK